MKCKVDFEIGSLLKEQPVQRMCHFILNLKLMSFKLVICSSTLDLTQFRCRLLIHMMCSDAFWSQNNMDQDFMSS